MKTYLIRINTIDNLFADYMVEANNLFEAKEKAKNAFFRDYPGANININLELENATSKALTEIMSIIKGAN